MKVYISGKITGLPVSEYEKKFRAAEDLLISVGLDPVNPVKNGLDQGNKWESRMVRDIEMLLGCEAIYMLDNWTRSKGARIEHKIAEETDIEIMYEGVAKEYFNEILRIQLAIKEVTGICFADYTSSNRGRNTYFARLIFARRCGMMGLNKSQIAVLLNRDRSTVSCYLEKFTSEFRFNTEFRVIAKSVDNQLKRTGCAL